MNRTVRNGLAIAGMAGGMWLLGHAVANADTGQAAAASNTSTQSQTDSGGGSSSNDSTNVAKAGNSNSTTVTTGTISGGNGGTNTATINTGASPNSGSSGPNTASSNTSPSGGGGGGGGGSSANVSTGSVTLSQQANGGSVSGSGNVHVNNSTTQSASAHNTVSQSSSSSGDSKSHDGNKQDGASPNSMGGDSHGRGNDSTNIAKAGNWNSTDVSTGDIYGGNGGLNQADINTGLLVVEPGIVYEPSYSGSDQVGRDEHGNIHIKATTGAVWVRQEANGGDVSDSGNVDVTGNTHQSASASNDVTQTSTSADSRKHDGDKWSGGGQDSMAFNSEGQDGNRGGNDSKNIAKAGNWNETSVETGDIYGGNGGENDLAANTGVVVFFFDGGPLTTDLAPSGQYDGGGNKDNRHHRSIDVSVTTGDVWASQEANGGNVSGSGNVCVSSSADQAAWAGNDVTQSSSNTGHKNRGGNDSLNVAKAGNWNDTSVETGDIYGGNGGLNYADINTGALIEPFFMEALSPSTEGGDRHHRSIDVSVTTGDVWASQEANGGNVSDSGNVSVDSSANQAAWAGNDVTQNSSNTGHRSRGGNDSKNIAKAGNFNSTDVSTGDIYGGNGGENDLSVNTGLEGPFFFGGLPNNLDVTTGDVAVSQEANGGNVSNSGNVSVGKGAECGCQQHAKPVASTPAAPAPAAAAVKAAAKKTAVMSSAQPTGTLAKTGADTEAPLLAGLLALGAGGALTMAGRRRRESDVA